MEIVKKCNLACKDESAHFEWSEFDPAPSLFCRASECRRKTREQIRNFSEVKRVPEFEKAEQKVGATERTEKERKLTDKTKNPMTDADQNQPEMSILFYFRFQVLCRFLRVRRLITSLRPFSVTNFIIFSVIRPKS